MYFAGDSNMTIKLVSGRNRTRAPALCREELTEFIKYLACHNITCGRKNETELCESKPTTEESRIGKTEAYFFPIQFLAPTLKG